LSLAERLKVLARKRSYLDVLSDILLVALDGAKKTHIMYRANLSYSQLEVYLNFALLRGLLERHVDNESEVYVTSIKGKIFLYEFRRLKRLLDLESST